MKRILRDGNGQVILNSLGQEVEIPYHGTFDFNGHYYKVSDEVVPNASWINSSQLKQNIEGILNRNKYYLEPKNCSKSSCTCRILIQLELEEDQSTDRTLNIFNLSSRADSGNWSIQTTNEYQVVPPISAEDLFLMINNGALYTPAYDVAKWTISPQWESNNVQAHEVGHLFNWPDEYFDYGGAVNPMYIKSSGSPLHQIDLTVAEPVDFWKRHSLDNLMGSSIFNQSPLIQKYYMYQIRDWFEQQTGISWDVKA